MSTPLGCCVPCSTPELVLVPGYNGTNGVNAFTLIHGNQNCSGVGVTAPYTVDSTAWVSEGQYIFIEGIGTFQVIDVLSATTLSLLYVNYYGNTMGGAAIPDGTKVSPSGAPPIGMQLFGGAGSPVGVVMAQAPALYDDTAGGLWRHTNYGGPDNTSWVQIIAYP